MVILPIWALIISQVLQALRLEIANKAGVDPFDVSIGLLVQRHSTAKADPVKVFVERGGVTWVSFPSRRNASRTTHTCDPGTARTGAHSHTQIR